MRLASAFLIAASTLIGWGASVGLLARLQLRRPEVRLRGVHDEDAEAVLRGLDLALGNDDLLLGPATSASACTMSIGAIVPSSDLLLVVPERRRAQLERLLRDLQLADRVDQVEVGVANAYARSASASAGAARRRFPASFWLCSRFCRVASMVKLLSSGCVYEAARLESSCGLNGAGRVVRCQPRRVEAERIAPAAPRHELLNSRAGPEAVSRGDVVGRARGEKVRRRRGGTPRRRARRQVQPVRGAGLGDAVGLDLWTQPVRLHAEIVLERHPHGLVRRHPQDRRCCGRIRAASGGRLGAACRLSGSGHRQARKRTSTSATAPVTAIRAHRQIFGLSHALHSLQNL